MKIQSVRAIPVKLPLPHVMEWATGRMTAQSHVLVRIMTDEGIEGIAEAIPRENIYGETQAGMVHVINDHLAPLIIGLDSFDVEKVHEKMDFIKSNLAAKGGIDVALWDIIGKACGKPIHKLLGGYRESIAPSRILWLSTDEVLADQARELNERGYRAFKVKGGPDPDADIRRIHLLREVVTPDTRLYIDGNQLYTYFGAKKVYDATRGELDYFEEPVNAQNERDRVRLAHAIDIPIVGDESNFTLGDIAYFDDYPKESRVKQLSKEKFAELVRLLGAERVLFGTDSPWAEHKEQVERIESCPLSDEEKALILGGNAKKLLNL